MKRDLASALGADWRATKHVSRALGRSASAELVAAEAAGEVERWERSGATYWRRRLILRAAA